MNFRTDLSILDQYISGRITKFIFFIIGIILLSISSKVSIPFFPVPMTLQTFVVYFIAASMGIVGFYSTLSYVFLGLVGLPIFAAGGGLGYLTSPTFGFLYGMLIASFIIAYFSKNMLIIYSLNLILALPAIYYIFVLDINFLNKTAATNFNEGEKIFFNNIFNDILITFTIIFFYFLPFLIEKIIKFEKVYRLDYLIFSLILFSVCVYFFNYNYSYSGGGIFFKISYFVFNNNFFFYIIGLISILIFLPYLFINKENFIILVLILFNNPQYTIYHKYFDPFLLIIFFSLFNFQISLKEKKIKNFITIYLYFFIFL